MPAKGLRPGQQVEVRVSGFPIDASVLIARARCDGALRHPSVPCRYTCVLVATVGGLPTPAVSVARLRFAAHASAVGVVRLRVRPDVGLRNGQDVHVDLLRFLSDEKVWLSECAPTERPTRTGCDGQVAVEPFTVTDDSGIRRGVVFRVTAEVHGRRCVPTCAVAAVGNDDTATAHISFGNTPYESRSPACVSGVSRPAFAVIAANGGIANATPDMTIAATFDTR